MVHSAETEFFDDGPGTSAAAHPRFEGHFRDPIYDPDRANNDDVLPFGTDEGFDTVWDWAERADELCADPRLDLILGGGLAAMLDAGLAGDQDSAAVLIAAGFTLLRYTGAIDPQGREALRLTLLDLSVTDDAAHQMLTDFDTFYTPEAQSDASRSPTVRSHRSTRPWLVITGPPNDLAHNRWLKGIAGSVMADETWRQGWTSGSKERLLLHTSPLGPPEGVLRVELDEPSRLCLIGTDPEVVAHVRELIEAGDAEPGISPRQNQPGPIHELAPNGANLYRQLILTMLQRAAHHLGMPEPPAHLPSAGQRSHGGSQ